MLKIWNVVARPRDRHAGDPRHVPRALGDPRLDPRVRRVDARRAVRDPHRDDDRRLDRRSSSGAATRCAPSTGSTRCCRARRSSCCNNLVLVAMAFVVFWGTFFPLIAEAVTGTRRALGPAVVRPVHGAAGDRARAAERDRAGDRLAQGDGRPTRGATSCCRRRWRWGSASCSRCSFGSAERPLALLMFVCGGFVVFSVGQEFWRGVGVRRAMTGEGPLARAALAGGAQPAALRRLPRARRDGAAVHRRRGVDGVQRRARRAPGARPDRAASAATTSPTCRPTSRVSTSGAGELEKISFGAIVDVRRDGKKVVDAAPERGYFPSRDVQGLGPVGRFFEGEATSEVGLKAGRAARPVGGDDARHPQAAADDRGGRPRLQRGGRQAAAGARGPGARRGAEGDRRQVRRQQAGGDVPRHHLAARRRGSGSARSSSSSAA